MNFAERISTATNTKVIVNENCLLVLHTFGLIVCVLKNKEESENNK